MKELILTDADQVVMLHYTGLSNHNPNSYDNFSFEVKASELMDALALFHETKREMEEDNK